MGLDVPVYKVGDRVYDTSNGCYLKATVIGVKKTWYGTHNYFLRHEMADFEPPARSHRDLELLESQEDVQRRMAQEHIENRIKTEKARRAMIMKTPSQEPEEWFDVIAYTTPFIDGIESGDILRACFDGDTIYRVESYKNARKKFHFDEAMFWKIFSRYNIEDYATEYPRKGGEKMEWIAVVTRKHYTIRGRVFDKGSPFHVRKAFGGKYELLLSDGDIVQISVESLHKAFEEVSTTPAAPKRSKWFQAEAKSDYFYTGRGGVILKVKEGEVVRMRSLSDGTYELNLEGEVVRLSALSSKSFRYAEEENAMGAELYGYPPEEDLYSAEEKRAAAKIALLEEQVKELTQKNEVARREEVAKEYGIVAERHLWDVVIDVPMSWAGARPRRGGERSTEVITESRNMVEAAMAAEALAKGIDEKAYVEEIKYKRVVGAIK